MKLQVKKQPVKASRVGTWPSHKCHAHSVPGNMADTQTPAEGFSDVSLMAGSRSTWEEELQVPSTCPVPGTALGTHVRCIPHSVLTGTLGNRRYYPHFTDEETEAQKHRSSERLRDLAEPREEQK